MKTVYKDPLNGKLYATDDPRFIGQGNPPTFPNPEAGAGRVAVEPESVSDKTKTEPKGRDPYKPNTEELERAALAATLTNGTDDLG